MVEHSMKCPSIPFAVVFCALISPPAFAQTAPFHLEAENAQLLGPSVQTTRTGFSGAGYASGLTKDGDKIVWTMNVPKAGVYDARLRFSSPHGEKGCDLVVNGAKTSAMLPKTGEVFESVSLGKVELRAGQNTLAIEKGWGYYDVDALDFLPAKVSDALLKPSSKLADPKATPQARALMRFLVSQYGHKMLSGQYEEADSEYIRQKTGQLPSIRGGDLMDYSPSRTAFGAKSRASEELMGAARRGQIVTLSWHWNAPDHLINATYQSANGKAIEAPWHRGFYTDATTFDVQAALANPNSNDYKLLLRDIDAIALQLKKFSDARVPVLWRPLHEAQGGWFWWGAHGPDSFKALWRLMFLRLTQTHDLHNLIWVNSSGDDATWYPGDDCVDIVGIDAYPTDASDALSATWDKLSADFGGRKLLALTEFGRVPDIEKMRRFGVRWSYFVSWTGDLGPKAIALTELKRLYSAPSLVNHNVLPRGSGFEPSPISDKRN